MATNNSSIGEIKNSLKEDAFPIASHEELLSSFICGPNDPVCVIGDMPITPLGIFEKTINENFPIEDAEKFTQYLAEIYGLSE